MIMTSLRTYQNSMATPENSAAATMEDVTIPLCEAFLALRQGNAERAVELMLPIRHRWHCVGGSHAQSRALYEKTVRVLDRESGRSAS